MTEKDRFLIWRAECCGETIISDSYERWSMDKCGCGRSGVDAERDYTRVQGNITRVGTADTKEKAEEMKADAEDEA